MELKFYAVGRRRPMSAFADKDYELGAVFSLSIKMDIGRFASQRRTSVPRNPFLGFNSFGVNHMTFTAVYQKADEGGYLGFVSELPGVITQGETLKETRENLHEAAALVLEGNRILTEESLVGQEVIREPLIVL